MKFQNSTGYKIPQNATSGMSQVNSPGTDHQIPDIGTTACHAENYNLKGKRETEKKQVQ